MRSAATRRPYLWRKNHPHYGQLFGFRAEAGAHVYFPRRAQGFTGWNPDVHRFVCWPVAARGARFAGTWRAAVYGPRIPRPLRRGFCRKRLSRGRVGTCT